MNYERCIKWQGHSLSIKTGEVAHLADGAVFVRYGDTVILATAVIDKQSDADIDFLPLTVNYIEKYYAAGRIPGGFFKREGKPNEHEVLKSRLIDRAIRPLLPSGMRNEVQVIITVLAYDAKVGTVIPSLIAASAALTISGIPFKGPIAGVRVCYDGQKYFSSHEVETDCDLYVIGTKNKIVTLEGTGQQFTTTQLVQACQFGMCTYAPVIELIEDMQSKLKVKTIAVKSKTVVKEIADSLAKYRDQVTKALFIADKKTRRETLRVIQNDAVLALDFPKKAVIYAYDQMKKDILRDSYVQKKSRIDGRGFDDLRPMSASIGLLPGVHGSVLYARGETQTLVTLTLGRPEERQFFDELAGYYAQNFMFHYNFLPYCVGETDRIGPPSRREQGHGYLAWRALKHVLPANSAYALRIVSEILASNGGSSMSSVCAGTLVLLSSGISIKEPVAGVALGYFKHGKEEVILTDILGDEDALGAMDLKIAGTANGFTAIQMDIKSEGVSLATLKKVLAKAPKAIKTVLEQMETVVPNSKRQMPASVPRIDAIDVNRNKVKLLLSKSAKIVRDIQTNTNTRIEVKDKGRVIITGKTWKDVYAAKKMIRSTIQDPEKDRLYDGVITHIDKCGIKVEFNKYLTGMLRFKNGKDEAEARSVLNQGDTLKVKFMSLDRRGEINLTWIPDTLVHEMQATETPTDYFSAICEMLDEEDCALQLDGTTGE